MNKFKNVKVQRIDDGFFWNVFIEESDKNDTCLGWVRIDNYQLIFTSQKTYKKETSDLSQYVINHINETISSDELKSIECGAKPDLVDLIHTVLDEHKSSSNQETALLLLREIQKYYTINKI
jgi:hypothetical protein